MVQEGKRYYDETFWKVKLQTSPWLYDKINSKKYIENLVIPILLGFV